MGQISDKMRKTAHGFTWWCTGCEEAHPLPFEDGRWSFNGNFKAPTFTPSFKHDWGNGKCCHYIVTDGQIAYCGDCTHALAGQTIPMPDLPSHMRDNDP